MNTQTKTKNTISYVTYGKAKNAQWDAETKLEVLLERVKQASRLLADQLVAAGAEQIDLINEPKKEKPFRVDLIGALTNAMSDKKKALYNLKSKEELDKPATKEMIAWCSPSHIKKQLAQIDVHKTRTFIRKADVKGFLTKNVGTAVDDMKAMIAYRLGEEKLSAADAKAGIAPTKRTDKKAVKKERVDTTPKSDKEKIHAKLNDVRVIAQNSRDGSLNTVKFLIELDRTIESIK